MEITVSFPGGSRVDAHFGEFTVQTDQPASAGGEGSAPTPFALFLASLATCAGIYALGFCKQRGLSAEGLTIRQYTEKDSGTGMIGRVVIEIGAPPDFPEKYIPSLIRSAELCAVKKHIETPPSFEVKAVIQDRDSA
jgi:putative redox protein